MDKKRKVLWSIIIFVVAIGALGGYFCFQKWWDIKQVKIQRGLANEKFPWRDYTEQELNKMYPQIKNADVPTRITSEQTYANFREALRTNNLEMALEQLAVGTKMSIEAADNVKQFYKENKFIELFRRYPDSIKKVNMYESIAQYDYIYYSSQYKQELIGTINFIKDVNGDWKMDSL
jgi:hypothetical protein